MKTVCVFAKLKVGEYEIDAFEHSTFGKGLDHLTASDFIKSCQNLWKNYAKSYKITNVVIES